MLFCSLALVKLSLQYNDHAEFQLRSSNDNGSVNAFTSILSLPCYLRH